MFECLVVDLNRIKKSFYKKNILERTRTIDGNQETVFITRSCLNNAYY